MKLQIRMCAAVAAIPAMLTVPATKPAQALPVCLCNKEDLRRGIAQPRCGEVTEFSEKPGGKYEFIETGRGKQSLYTDDYQPCPSSRDECAKLIRQQTAAPDRKPAAPQTCPAVPAPANETERFAIYGSATIGERLIPRLIAEYAEDRDWEPSRRTCDGEFRLIPRDKPGRPALVIDCHAGGSDTGIPELAEEHAEIAMLSRPITPEEVKLMRMQGYPQITTALQEHVLALDGVSIIVSRRNPVNGLQLDEISRIFQQASSNRSWKFYLLDEKSGTRAIFETMIFAGEHKLPPCTSSNVQCFANPEEVAAAVAKDPQGIGFAGSAYGAATDVKIVPIVGQCGIIQEPSIFNIKTEDYLFSRQLLLYTSKVRSLQSSSFVFFAMSDRAQPAIEKMGYVNQTIAEQSPPHAEERLRQYEQSPPREPDLDHDPRVMRDLHQTLKGAARLSISFRFRFNSTTLDTRAVQDLHRLADYLTFEAKAKDRKILLAGFTDSKGDGRANIALGLGRAKAIADALEAIGIRGDRIRTKGGGELMPVACNDSELGQAKNRRVEVWMLPD
jgi:phosphate transport system substrate-binding protein